MIEFEEKFKNEIQIYLVLFLSDDVFEVEEYIDYAQKKTGQQITQTILNRLKRIHNNQIHCNLDSFFSGLEEKYGNHYENYRNN